METGNTGHRENQEKVSTNVTFSQEPPTTTTTTVANKWLESTRTCTTLLDCIDKGSSSI